MMLRCFAAITILFSSFLSSAASEPSADSMVIYLREGWPQNGQPFKPYQPDAGRLLRTPPEDLEEVWCGIWAQYDFDDIIEKQLTVDSLYVRVWLYSINGEGTSAFHFDGGFDDKITESTAVQIKPGNAKSRAYRYDLHCYHLSLDEPAVLDPNKPFQEDGSAFRFTYKWLAPSNQPIVTSKPGMISFIWLNPPPVAILEKTDSDGDGLTDLSEISQHYTSPFEKDTDNDGITDPEELESATDPNNSDTDLDSILDGTDETPTKPNFDETLDRPHITKYTRFRSRKLLLRGGIEVDNGATAAFRDCELVLQNSDDVKASITVTKGSTLVANNCVLRSLDGRTLYPVTIDGRVEMNDCKISDARTWRINGSKSIFRHCRFDYNFKTFEIEGSDNLIEKCDFDHAHFGVHVYLKGKARGNIVQNCRFDHALFSAIEIHEDATGNIIEGCKITRCDHAIVLKSKAGKNVVRKCEFRLNNSSVSLSSPENVVEKNRFSGSAWGHITFGHGSKNIIRDNTIRNAEISLWEECNENLFENNHFEDIPGKAVLLKNGASGNIFRGNTFKNIGGPSIVICENCNGNLIERNEIVPPSGPVEVEEGATGNTVR